jgi:hypothetical protein
MTGGATSKEYAMQQPKRYFRIPKLVIEPYSREFKLPMTEPTTTRLTRQEAQDFIDAVVEKAKQQLRSVPHEFVDYYVESGWCICGKVYDDHR